MSSIFDQTALLRQRLRASDAFFQELAADTLQDRLELVNKAFSSPVVVTPNADLWRQRLPAAVIVETDDTLGFGSDQHDLAIHSLDLHWANDPVGQLIQCRRALKPDGLFLGASFGGQTLSELRTALAEAESQVTGGLSPRVAPMAEIRDLGALLQRAGFALPVADSIIQTIEYDDIWSLMRDLRRCGETSVLTARRRTFTRREVFQRAAEIYAHHFGAASGKIRATFEFVILTGWAPDESQPKPLRPGSAAERLANALGTQELPLRD